MFRARGNWPRALEGFDATLRLVPRHHDARLGRVLALTMLERHEDAIAEATSLVSEGVWFVGEAYYWRAWNEYTLGRIDESERDVAEAKQRTRWSPVLVLSGLVQWRKQRPLIAETEFAGALAMASDNCEAASYLGAVRAELRKWPPAAQAYAQAEKCRDNEASTLRATLNDLVAHGAPVPAIESQQKALATADQQAAEMAYNCGVMFANAGDIGTARGHIERASKHPALQEKASGLLQRVEKRR
jgi:tetratricopeptide (TPR) repeat protein